MVVQKLDLSLAWYTFSNLHTVHLHLLEDSSKNLEHLEVGQTMVCIFMVPSCDRSIADRFAPVSQGRTKYIYHIPWLVRTTIL